MKKYTIETTENGTEYKYNVKIFTSMDGGRTFYYAGNGKYFKTMKEAENYIKEVSEEG